jgi:hypothetical protein
MSTEDLIELSPDAKALLQAGGSAVEGVPSGSSERVLGRLAGTLSLSPAAVAAVSPVPLSPPASLPPASSGALGTWASAGLKLKFLVTMSALAAAVGLGTLLREPLSPSTQARAPLPATAASSPAAREFEPPGVAPSALGSAVTAPPRVARSGAPTNSASSAAAADLPSPSSLADERGLLDSARSALAAGNGRTALQTLSAHERRFPRGRLVEERESLIVQALAHTAGPAAARQRFTSFRRRFPKSIFLPALQAVVDSSP